MVWYMQSSNVDVFPKRHDESTYLTKLIFEIVGDRIASGGSFTPHMVTVNPGEIIKEWNVELQERTSKFRKQANAIAEWDRRILQNRDVLLKVEVGKLEATDGMTPMDVVVRILNNQLSSLMWIDEKVRLFFHIFIFLSLRSLNVVHKCLSDFEYCFFFSETLNSVILRKC
ncbi:putative nucleoporin, NSP1-like, nucleoporin NSP1/NUP62 [Helianthus anomalus]